MNLLSTLNNLCNTFQLVQGSNTKLNANSALTSQATSIPTTSFSEEISEIANSNQLSQSPASQVSETTPEEYMKQLNPEHLKKKLEHLKALEQLIQQNGGSVTLAQAGAVVAPQNNQGNNVQCGQDSGGGQRGQFMLQKLDTNGDGKITLQEVQSKETQISNLLNQQQTQMTTV